MADIFTLDELRTFAQKPDLDTTLATLARELATTWIRNEAGATVYDELTDLAPFKPMALIVARSLTVNPDDAASEAIDDFRVQYRSAADGLTAQEKADIQSLVGRGGAFSITPAAPTPYCAATWPHWPR